MQARMLYWRLRQAVRPASQRAGRPEVLALVGKAGTGKSFRARLVADNHDIDAIIDDGVLIMEGRILAGRSAKQDAHYMTAVRTAMFHAPAHRAEVAEALEQRCPARILLLGTSERMIRRNCQTLGLPEPKEWVRIEDIATEDEIAAAIRDRKTHGRHIIPLPSIEVKQTHPKLIARAIRVWFDQSLHRHKNAKSYEKSVVRPSYHRKGEITISEAALSQMLLHCIAETAPGWEARKIRIKSKHDGYEFRCDLVLPFGQEAAGTCQTLHDTCIREIEQFTGIHISKLTLHVQSVKPRPAEAAGNSK